MAILIKSAAEIARMRTSGMALRRVHDAVTAAVRPGATTMDLERAAAAKVAELDEEFRDRKGCKPAFLGYHGFPAILCTSVNEQVVHGIPSDKTVLREGDIVSIDCGVVIDGFYSDCAITHRIGKVSPAIDKLLKVTEASLYAAIDKAVVGGRLFDISFAVQSMCEAEGYGVVRELPNFGNPGKGPRLKAGMVLAIEPMINLGGAEVKVLPDGWTAITTDGRPSAHYEHTVAITKDGPVILTL
jgi:methionyl aminopeptidase